MRRDVNRSLLVWPAAASAAIVVGSWFHQPGRLAELHRQTVSAQAEIAGWWGKDRWWGNGPAPGRVIRGEVRPSPDWSLAPDHPFSPGADVAERRERGSRGPQVPDRLAGIWDPSSGPLTAPRIDERKELAGLASTLGFVLDVADDREVSVEDLTERRRAGASGGGIGESWENHRGGLGSFGSDLGIGPGEQPTLESQSPIESLEDEVVTLELPAVSVQGEAETGRVAATGPEQVDPTQLESTPGTKPGQVDLARAGVDLARAGVDLARAGEVPPSAKVASVRTRSNASDAAGGVASGNGTSAPDAERVRETEAARVEAGQVGAESGGADESTHGGNPRDRETEATRERTESARDQQGRSGWPVAKRLEQQLKTLTAVASGRRLTETRLVSAARPAVASGSDAVRWSADVQGLLTQLRSLERLAAPEAGELIDALSEQADEGLRIAEGLEDRREQLEWLRAGHALSRRLAVWDAIWRLASDSTDVSETSSMATRRVTAAIESVRRELAVTGDVEGWESYLLLADLERAATAGGPDGWGSAETGRGSAETGRAQVEIEAERALLAQRLLSRLRWHGLDPVHREWLDGEPITALAESVRGWNRTSVDFTRLLDQLESKESDSIDLASLEIADAVQSLRFASRPGAPRVAKAVDAHYRNANVRVAISDDFLERLIPEVEPQTVPVRAMLFGSRVRGVSRVSTDLRLQLRPSGDRWSLRLLSEGAVQTQSVGRNGPVAVRTSGASNFVASKPIEVTRVGVRLGDSEATVNGGSRLQGIETEYDGWPLIGSLVRGIATSRYHDLKPRTDRYAEDKVRREVTDEIDGRVEESIGEATERLNRSLFGPLGTMQLDPMVVDMQTTAQRLISRYRLAGDWQLAAFTPRPRAPRSSLMSLQIHQSAINNTVEQLVPREESRSIDAIVRETLSRFERPGTRLPDDIPADVMIQFAPTRPVTVEIEEGRLWVTMRVMRLSQGDRLDLRRFIVRAGYRPEVEGREARLVRDGHLSISGPAMSMRERFPVRAIFNKVFSTSRSLPLMLPVITEHPAMEDLVVSQLELRDGWVGFALSHRDAPRVTPRLAARPEE